MFRREFRAPIDDVWAAVTEPHRIVVCEPPSRLVTESSSPLDGTVWRLELDLSEHDGVTMLVFAQLVSEGVPGSGRRRPRGGVVWDDYYPSLADHYRAAFS